jgi:hypothetical protein
MQLSVGGTGILVHGTPVRFNGDGSALYAARSVHRPDGCNFVVLLVASDKSPSST